MIEGSHKCRLCNGGAVTGCLDLGVQPRCFDFGVEKSHQAVRFPLEFGCCYRCGFFQAIHPLSEATLNPDFDWVENKEPDDHAASLVTTVVESTLHPGSRVLSFSPFDQKYHSLFESFLGKNAVLLDPKEDLGIDRATVSQPQILSGLTVKNTHRIRKRYGEFDLLFMARLLEHSTHPYNLIQTLMPLLNEGGRLMVEVPDSSKPLMQGDIAMLWEEHTGYFTPDSIKAGLRDSGLETEEVMIWSYAQEDAMAILARKSNGAEIAPKANQSPTSLAEQYCSKINRLRVELPRKIKALRNRCGKVAVFGAGHRAAIFLNALEDSSLVDFVIDDAEYKQGLFMPGSGIEIISSARAVEESIKVVLFAVSLGAEPKLIALMKQKAPYQIEFFSTSPDSVHWIGSDASVQ